MTQKPTPTTKKWLNFLLFWQTGYYNGAGYAPVSRIMNRYFCWIDRHAFIIPFSTKLNEDKKSVRVTQKCKHCGYETYSSSNLL